MRTQATTNIRHAHLAAIQHGKIKIPDKAAVIGVVRKTMYGMSSVIDENIPELAPPEELLLEEFKPLAKEIGHNKAYHELDFSERYHEHLAESDAAQDEIQRLREMATDRPVYLLCYENVEDKQCHRTELVDVLMEGVSDE